MSANRPGASSIPAASAAMAAVCLGGLAWLFAGNPRLIASWHGFLHTGIAGSFSHSFPPENPYFAGEPLPYYWFYHFAGYWLSRALLLNPLFIFQAISWTSLLALVFAAGAIGRRCLKSSLAGVAIAYLGLCGLNPLGPAIAAAKHLSRGAPLVERWNGPIETTFVSNNLADRLMTEPLLGAMFLGNDWRQGPALVWFFDIGSRAPALAGLMTLLYLLLKPAPDPRRYLAIVALSALVTALNPLIGLAAAGALGLASLILRRMPLFLLSVACGVGALLAIPTYYQMFFRVSGSSGIGLRDMTGTPVVALNFLALLPLAVLGARKAANRQLTWIAAAGAILLALLAVVHLPEGNEHNLGNAAQCLLAIPAGAFVAYISRARIAIVFAIFIPVTAATLFAFTDRPAMPLAAGGPTLTRTPDDSGLQPFYDWIRRDTPRQTIFIVNPETPVKMSGNASELPAFTSRTLFTDLPNYLTTPNRDAAFRAQLAKDATEGQPLTAPQREYLMRFGRPVYVVTYQARGGGPVDRLTALYGPPAFQRGIVAAFGLADTQARR